MEGLPETLRYTWMVLAWKTPIPWPTAYGYGRGPYYKQGGYYIKSWGKHEPLTNPYAFRFLPNMPLDGEKKRFTHATMVYEGGQLPEKYAGKMMALNPLHIWVKSLQISHVSLMPKGILRKMEQEEIRDLFAYLLNTGNR